MSTSFRTKAASGRSSTDDHLQAAKDHLSRGEKAAAKQAIERALQAAQGDFNATIQTARAAFGWGELEMAKRAFRHALLQGFDDNSPITKAEVFYYLGAIAAKEGEKAKAVNMLERAIDSDPSYEAAQALLRTLRG